MIRESLLFVGLGTVIAPRRPGSAYGTLQPDDWRSSVWMKLPVNGLCSAPGIQPHWMHDNVSACARLRGAPVTAPLAGAPGVIETERLRMRAHRDDDLADLVALAGNWEIAR